jgi:hypothetical protein
MRRAAGRAPYIPWASLRRTRQRSANKRIESRTSLTRDSWRCVEIRERVREIGVEERDHAATTRHDAGDDRAAFAAILREPEQHDRHRPARACLDDRGGVVDTAVVDDDDLGVTVMAREVRLEGVERGGEACRLVVGGHDQGQRRFARRRPTQIQCAGPDWNHMRAL